MDYEKNYNELHKFISDLYPHMSEYCKEKVEGFFPELAESEDEKIRKALIHFISEQDGFLTAIDGINVKDILSWLEKQGTETIPLEETIHNVWELGNLWKELTNGVCTTEHGRQLDYIVKHWKDGEHYIKSIKKRGEQKHVNNLKWDELTWQDINTLEGIINNVDCEFSNGIGAESFGKEVLERFREIKGDEYMDSCEQKPTWREEEQKETLCDKCRREQPYHSCQDITELGRCTLEHQCEQKSNKVEPKFKTGDWIACDAIHTAKIIRNDGDKYEVESVDGTNGFYNMDYINRNFHHWTIEDAKDGDVLVHDEQVFLFRKIDSSNSFLAHCSYHFIGYDNLSFCDCSYSTDNIHPATKKQYDHLLSKIKEAGYEWDADAKTIKIVDWSKHITCNYDNLSIAE